MQGTSYQNTPGIAARVTYTKLLHGEG